MCKSKLVTKKAVHVDHTLRTALAPRVIQKVEREDYDKLFVIVVSFAIHCIFTLFVQEQWELHQIDVETQRFYGKLNQVIVSE